MVWFHGGRMAVYCQVCRCCSHVAHRPHQVPRRRPNQRGPDQGLASAAGRSRRLCRRRRHEMTPAVTRRPPLPTRGRCAQPPQPTSGPHARMTPLPRRANSLQLPGLGAPIIADDRISCLISPYLFIMTSYMYVLHVEGEKVQKWLRPNQLHWSHESCRVPGRQAGLSGSRTAIQQHQPCGQPATTKVWKQTNEISSVRSLLPPLSSTTC